MAKRFATLLLALLFLLTATASANQTRQQLFDELYWQTMLGDETTSFEQFQQQIQQLQELASTLGQREQALSANLYCQEVLHQDPNEALELAQQLLLMHQNQPPSVIAELMTCEVIALQILNQHQQATALLEDTLFMAEQGDDDFVLARTRLSLAKTHLDEGQLKEALELLIPANQYFNQLGAPIWQARTLKDTASAFIRLRQWQTAEMYLSQALELKTKLPYFAFNELLWVQYDLQASQEQWSPALHTLEQLRISNPEDPYIELATAPLTLRIQILSQDPDFHSPDIEALALRISELDWLSPDFVAYLEWHLSSLKALYDLHFGDGLLATQFFSDAISDSAVKLDRQFYLEALLALSKSHRRTGNFEQALDTLELYLTELSNLLDEAYQAQLGQLQLQLENERQERENRLLQQQQQLNEQRIAELERLRQWQILSIMMMAIAVLGILVALWQQYQRSVLLKTMALTDELTGIANRRAVLTFAEQQLARAQEQKIDFAALVIDIDHFKLFNDQHGHETGDQVLKLVSQGLKAQVREQDFLGRSGGEEFLVILTKVNKQQAFESAERLRIAVEQLRLDGIEQRITVSIGLALWQGENELQALICRADRGLYLAKQSGRNQCCAIDHD